MNHTPKPDLDDEENDMVERYAETGEVTDVGEDIPMWEEEKRDRLDIDDTGYELGDVDGNTDADDEFEELAEEETEGQYGIEAEDLTDGFHVEDLSDDE